MIWTLAAFELIKFCEFLKGLSVGAVERLYMLIPDLFMGISLSALFELQFSFSPCLDQLLLELYLDHSGSGHFSYQSVVTFLVLIVLKSFIIWTFVDQLSIFIVPALSKQDVREMLAVVG